MQGQSLHWQYQLPTVALPQIPTQTHPGGKNLRNGISRFDVLLPAHPGIAPGGGPFVLEAKTHFVRGGNFCLVIIRSEEHTSELQSRPHLVCRLLLEKKKKDASHIVMLVSTQQSDIGQL